MSAIEGADCLIVVTEWREFSNPDYTEMKRVMRGNLICDGRNLLSPQKVQAQGLTYFGIGR